MKRIAQFCGAYAGIVALLIVSGEILSQTLRIVALESSREISLIAMTLRIVATLLLLYRFASIKDRQLIVGQTFFLLILLTYAGVVVRYRFWPPH